MQKNTKLVGFWSALSVATFSVWFMVAFGLYAPAIMNWSGIESFAGSFRPAGYVAWVLPCLLLALSFPILGTSILMLTDERNRIWGILGLVFAACYGAILATDYWLLLTVVRQSISAANFDGLSWLVVGSPHSITNSIEGIGYALMGMAFIFQSLCFDRSNLGLWIRSLLLINGTVTFLSVVIALIGFPVGTWSALAIWGVTFPSGCILAAIYFKKQQ